MSAWWSDYAPCVHELSILVCLSSTISFSCLGLEVTEDSWTSSGGVTKLPGMLLSLVSSAAAGWLESSSPSLSTYLFGNCGRKMLITFDPVSDVDSGFSP